MSDLASEVYLGEVYFTPWLVVVILSYILSIITSVVLNRLRVSNLFFSPPLTFVAFMVIYAVLIDRYFIKF